ncbi:MAG TPA: MFS transporter [Chthonomonadaceae bacterium]|nr:MFS transporter [Chthonomonadaceae bacterium]
MPQRFNGLWQNRDFLKLWAAKTVSNFGTMISGTALAFTAILMLKATPAQLSLLLMANLLPRFLAGLVAGVWVDRLRRRPIMIYADIGRALLLGTIPVAALLHRLRIEQLLIVTLLAGLLTLCFDIADTSYLPALVRPEELVEGNSKLTASASAAEFSAFSLAGWLVQWFTGPMAILIDALSFVWSAILLGRIRTPEPPPIPHAEREGIAHELKGGLRTVRANPYLTVLTLVALFQGAAHGIFGTVVVAFMARDLGFQPGVLGMIWAVGGITSMLGALGAGTVARRLGMGRTLALGLLVSGLGSLLIPLAHGATLLAGALLVGAQVVCDPAATVYDINAVSLRQAVTPLPMQGRVNSIVEFTGLGANLLGALAGGILGARIGLRSTLFVGVSAPLLAALLLWFSPVARLLEPPVEAQQMAPMREA